MDEVGGAGLGLVWGWRLGLVGPVARSPGGAVTSALATGLLVAEAVWLGGSAAAATVVGGALVGWLLHVGWQWALRRRATANP